MGREKEKNVEQNKDKQKVGLKPLRQTEEREKNSIQSSVLQPVPYLK